MKFGSEALRPFVRAPYEFCEKWILHKELKNKKFLDYGCGTGIFSVLPAKKGALVTGIDISPEMIKVAKKRAINNNVEQTTFFEQGNCESLVFTDNSFDFVSSAGVFCYLKLNRAYSEIARVLKPDGYAIIIETLRHNPILNLNRKIKFRRGLKNKQTITHILGINDIYKAGNYFGKIKIYTFDLATLILAPFGYHFESYISRLSKIFCKIDRLLLSIPFLKRYAFKVVYILSEPRKVNKELKINR